MATVLQTNTTLKELDLTHADKLMDRGERETFCKLLAQNRGLVSLEFEETSMSRKELEM
jgi:hypothetical protein